MPKTKQLLQLIGLSLCTASAVKAQTTMTPTPPPTAPPVAPAPTPPESAAQPPAEAAPPEAGVAAPEQAAAPPPPATVVEPPPPMPVEMMPPPKSGTEAYVGKAMVGINWDVAVPVGSVHNFSSNVSAVGFELAFHYWLDPRLTVGASLDWQTYWDSRPRQTYYTNNGAITATADNSVQTGAARANFRFWAVDNAPILPYLGLNIGVGWQTFETTAADLVLYDNTLSILLGGELGVAFAASMNSPLFTVGARYSTLPAANFLYVTNIQAITFQFGLMSR